MRLIKPILCTVLFVLFCALSTIQAQYSDPQTLFSTPLAEVSEFKVVDYNNDGLNDIVANSGGAGGNYTYFLKGTENSFEIDQRFQFDHTIRKMTFHDFDNDGDLDFYSNNIIYENDNFVFVEKTELSGINPSNIAIYDIDKDGLPDIIPGVSSFNNNIDYPYFKNNGNLEFTNEGDFSTSFGAAQIKIADLDNDGNNEIIRAYIGNIFVHTLVDTNKLDHFEFNNVTTAINIEVGDINGDGIVDLINQNDDQITAYILHGEDFTFKHFDHNNNQTRFRLFDYNNDQILDIISYYRDLKFITYKNGELTLEKTLSSNSSGIFSISDSEIFSQGENQFLLHKGFNALYLFDLENDVLSDGSLVLEDFTNSFSLSAITNNNDNLNYAFIEGATLNILKLNPNTHQKEIDQISLKDDVRNARIVELENGNPVYLISYKNDNGLYILDVQQPTFDQINSAVFQFTNVPLTMASKVDKNLSCLIIDGLDIFRLTYDSEYKVEYLRTMDNLPRRIMEVDLNHDGNDDILWISNFSVGYYENTSNGYGDFIQLEIADNNSFFGFLKLMDIDEDGEIEIVNTRHSEVKVWELDSNFGFEETSYEVENASHTQFTGNLDENIISLYRNDGHISIIYDFQDFLNSGNTDIDLMIDPIFGGSSFFRDLDSDGDRDIVIDNYYSLSVSLFGDEVATTEISQDLILYPNPTNGYFNIKSNEDVKIQAIFNSKGERISDKTDLEGMPSGIYFIQLKKANKTQVVKIIKS